MKDKMKDKTKNMEFLDLSLGNTLTKNTLKIKNFKKVDNSIKKTKLTDCYYLPEDQRKKYEYNTILVNIHWGQLKLFMSEFFTLTEHVDFGVVKKVLYIGAAPGNHIIALVDFFEELEFHLYDTQDFDSRLKSLDNVKINQRYFTDEDLENWKSKDKDYILISDIRSLDYSPDKRDKKSKEKNEIAVWNDMKLQEKWVVELEPSISLLKFRLPFAYDFILKEGKTRKYLDGKVLKQVYNKPSSSETRLLVTDIKFKDWDITKYEEQSYYHNSVTRQSCKYYNPLTGTYKPLYKEVGLSNDFDSTYFYFCVTRYLNSIGETVTDEKVKSIIKHILDNIDNGKTSLINKKAGF